MAVRNLTEVAGMLTFRDRIPRDVYDISFMEASFEASSKGNMMIILEPEIVGPEKVTVNGQAKIVAGVKCNKMYFPTIIYKDVDGVKVRDDAASEKALDRLRELYSALRIDMTGFDDENPILEPLKKVVARAVLGAEETKACKDPTPEQLAKGQKFGDPIIENGKEVVSYRINVTNVLGLSSKQVGKPF